MKSSYARLCRTKIRKSRRYRYLKNAGHPSGGPAGRDIAFETRRNLSQGHKGVGKRGGLGILKTRNADHERTGRTNVTSRATSSPTIRPSCTTGCLQTRQGGAVASDMKSPKQPRHSAECPLPSQASCASAQRQCVKRDKASRAELQTRTDTKRKQTYHPKRTWRGADRHIMHSRSTTTSGSKAGAGLASTSCSSRCRAVESVMRIDLFRFTRSMPTLSTS